MVENPVKIILFGQEGVGKTTFASMLPNPWFIDTEASTKWIPSLKNRQYHPRPKKWSDFVTQLNMFKQTLPGDTLVIDSGDWMEALLIDNLCARKNWEAIGGNNDHGNSYLILEKEVRKLLDELSEISEMGVNIIITCHVGIRTQTNPGEVGSWDRYELKVQRKTAGAMKEWADAILFIHFEDVVSKVKVDNKGNRYVAQGGTNRLIECCRSASWDGKNRFDWPATMPFNDKKIPEIILDFFRDNYGPQPQPQDATQAPVQYQPQSQPVQQPQPAPAVQVAATQMSQATQPVQPQAQKPAPAQVDTAWMQYVIPPLLKLMDDHMIKKEEIEAAVDMQGFLGKGTHFDISQYPQDFQMALVQKWDDMVTFMIDKGITLPF